MNKIKIAIIACFSVCLALLIYPIISHIQGIISTIEYAQRYFKYYYDPADANLISSLMFQSVFLTVSMLVIFAILVTILILFLKVDLTVYGDQYQHLRDIKRQRKAEERETKKKLNTEKRKAELLAELDEINRKDKENGDKSDD